MIDYGLDGPSGRMLDILPIFALPPNPILSQSWLLWNTIFKGKNMLNWSTEFPTYPIFSLTLLKLCYTFCKPCDGQGTIKSETYSLFQSHWTCSSLQQLHHRVWSEWRFGIAKQSGYNSTKRSSKLFLTYQWLEVSAPLFYFRFLI